MNVSEAIKGRRSHRKFADRPIDRKDLEGIVEAGRWAPTARADEPWEMVVVTSPGRLKEIADLTDYGKFIAGSAACIAVLARPTKYYLEDCSAATQNMLLEACARGIASCWAAGDKKPYCAAVLKALSAPEGYKLVSLIALGYPAGPRARGQRKRSLPEILHWEQF